MRAITNTSTEYSVIPALAQKVSRLVDAGERITTACRVVAVLHDADPAKLEVLYMDSLAVHGS